MAAVRRAVRYSGLGCNRHWDSLVTSKIYLPIERHSSFNMFDGAFLVQAHLSSERFVRYPSG